MPLVRLTPHLRAHLECADLHVSGETVAVALQQVFARYPRLRSYLLDDQAVVRQHVAVFVNSRPLKDRVHQADAVADHDVIDVFQALSGG
jgi:sulfur-carrier protein